MALNSQQIDTINFYLDGLITEEQKSITPKKIFNEVKKIIDLDYDKFVLALIYLFKIERIQNYTFLSDGTICHKNNFHEKPKLVLKQKNSQPINIDGFNYTCSYISKNYLIKILKDIFHAKENSGNNKVIIDNIHFDCDTEILYRFLDSFYGLKKENGNENSCASN